MSDINSQLTEAKSNISSARRELESERVKVQQYEDEAKAITVPRRSIEFQQSYIKDNRAMAGKTEQIMHERKTTKEKALAEAARVKSELNTYEQTQLIPAEKEVAQAEQSNATYQSQIGAYEAVKKIAVESRDRVGVGFNSARYRNKAREAFERAGLQGTEGEAYYRDLVGADLQNSLWSKAPPRYNNRNTPIV